MLPQAMAFRPFVVITLVLRMGLFPR